MTKQTPKEKAEELVLEFENYSDSADERGFAKRCALMTIDKIIKYGNLEPQLKRHIGNVEPSIIHIEYWFKVKEEIKKL